MTTRRTVPKKCPKCNGGTYQCSKLTRKCNDMKCGYFYTGIAMKYYEIKSCGYDIHLIEA